MITLERNLGSHQKRSKELIPKKNAKWIKKDKFTRSNREKLNIGKINDWMEEIIPKKKQRRPILLTDVGKIYYCIAL